MDQKIYHGQVTPSDIAQGLISFFHRGNYRVQQIGQDEKISVQIGTTNQRISGGATTLTINLQKVVDGTSVSIGQQAWYGIAASIGYTALSALKNPFTLLGRLDDIAQDLESLQLKDQVWSVIDHTALSLGASYQLSDDLRRLVCTYCSTANPVGEPHCIGCGAPLGDEQPETCNFCGFVVKSNLKVCPNCGNSL